MASTYPTTLDAFTNPSASSLLTSPSHAQQHSDINDAMEAVQTKLAIGNTVIGTYTSYTPTFSDITLGNGTVTSYYCRVNKLVHYWGRLTFGSTTSITATGPQISLPVNQATAMPAQQFPMGSTVYLDASAGARYIGQAAYNNAGSFRLWTLATGVSYTTQSAISSTIPMTWTTSDTISWNIEYEGI